MDPKTFPVSVWYGANRARAPMFWEIQGEDHKRIRADFQSIRSSGFNTVRLWYDWLTAEKRPDQWDFSGIITLLELSHQAGLKSVIQVYSDSAPNWVESEYPDSLFMDRSGLVIRNQASPGYCTDHPKVREHVGDFYYRLAEVATRFPSFLGWDVWSEPHIVEWSWIDYMKEPWFCFCRHSQNRFRAWLQNRYECDLDHLNRNWYRTYRYWEEVQPPGYISLSTFRDVVDWIHFNTEKIAEDLAWKVDHVKKADPDHVVSSHAAISSVYGMPGIGYGASDDWLLARQVDVWGTSLYPKHTGPWMPLKPHQICVALDATASSCRSAAKPFWVGELQTGDGVTGMRFGESVTAEDVDRWAWRCVSRGATGLHYYAWYPMSCGYEISGFGLCEPDGSVNDRVWSAGNVGRIVSENEDLFMKAKPAQADVAILYNIEAHSSLAGLRVSAATQIRKDMFGFYRVLMELGIPVEFVHLDDIAEGMLAQYRFLYMPSSYVLTERHARRIQEFVARGGTVMADFRVGWMNDQGELSLKIPGMGLDRVFGCYEDDTVDNRDKKIISSHLYGPIPAHEHLSTFIVTDGKSLAEYNGRPVIVKNQYEEGAAYMIGTQIGCVLEEENHSGIRRFLSSAVEDAGIVPYCRSFIRSPEGSDAPYEVRINISDERRIVFVFNDSSEPLTLGLEIPFPLSDFEPVWKNLKTGEERLVQCINGVAKMDLLIEQNETGVYVLGKPHYDKEGRV